MRRALYLMIGMGLGALAASGARQLKTQDPVKLSPQYYSVRFENDRVRVLEYHLKPGEKEVMHSHPSGVVFYLSDATFRTTHPDGVTSDVQVQNGQVLWREVTSHAAENIGQTEAHAYAVELKPGKP